MNGETFVIYTTEVGGLYKIVRASEEEYASAVASGVWDETPPDWDIRPTDPRQLVELKMIALLRVEDNHDFVLGGSRDNPDTWHEKYREKSAA